MPKQTTVPGTERTHHKDITKAAEAYVAVRDERMEMTEREVEKRAALTTVMLKHELEEYVDEDAEIRVTVSQKEPKAKVSKYKPEGGTDGE